MAAAAGCTSDLSGSDGEYPSDTVDVVVPFGTGGGTDTAVRAIYPALEDELGTNIVVDNRSGAGGRVGFEHMAQQSADGYTIGAIALSTGVLGSTLYNPDFDMQELTPIAGISTDRYGLIARPGEYDDFWDWLDDAQQNGTTISSVGAGSNVDIGIRATFEEWNIDDYEIVPYDGGGESTTAVASGDVDVTFNYPPSYFSQANSGDIETLWWGDTEPFPGTDHQDQDDVPNMNDIEYDFPQEILSLEVSMFAPAGLDDEVRETLEEAVIDAREDDEFQEMVEGSHGIISDQAGDELAETVDTLTEELSQYDDAV
ncbi:Bug family tripartite tricarboxylate transporter substrate binding protein [Natrialbaceae archaeon A-arb3/5]